MRKYSGMLAVMIGVLVWVGAASATAAVVGKDVEYLVQGATMKSYLAYDADSKDRRPGVMVVPEWWGINDYVRKRARMLAELGHIALAVDMYGGGRQAATAEEAGELSSKVMSDFASAAAAFKGGMDFLKGQPGVDPNRIAAIGYCFGGGVVLNMARQGASLRGVVSFHGGLTAATSVKPDGVTAKILVLTGDDDPLVPREQVNAFEKEMRGAGADFRVVSYPGAKHSFTNPDADALGKKFNLPVAYNAEADTKSWAEMKAFLKTIFA